MNSACEGVVTDAIDRKLTTSFSIGEFSLGNETGQYTSFSGEIQSAREGEGRVLEEFHFGRNNGLRSGTRCLKLIPNQKMYRHDKIS
jgi:hypothetical protein